MSYMRDWVNQTMRPVFGIGDADHNDWLFANEIEDALDHDEYQHMLDALDEDREERRMARIAEQFGEEF